MEKKKIKKVKKSYTTLQLNQLEDKLNYVFDYEVNSVKTEDNDDLYCKMYFFDNDKKQYRIINYNSFRDNLLPLYKFIPNDKNPRNIYDNKFQEIDKPTLTSNVKKASLIKRLVSKTKRRLQNENFDLDLTYITERVIAMGFPSSGCESMYRNSLSDIISFFHIYHGDRVKIYNLCLEKERIYKKELFPNCQVGLFPATDHNPCPIKLILQFCVDICLYLIKNPDGVAAVHCKAGKGRTGVMICSYLIFSRLCENSDMAFRYYARIRTMDNSGVTIPSQKRYIKYFETFLKANFCPPYIFLIPKIIKYHFSEMYDEEKGRILCNNILDSFRKVKSYFISPNTFKLQKIKVGPLPSGKNLVVNICNFVNKGIGEKSQKLNEITEKGSKTNNYKYYDIEFTPPLTIHSDIKITITGGVNFYIWVNLWYSSWELIKQFYDSMNENGEIVKEENRQVLLKKSTVLRTENLCLLKYEDYEDPTLFETSNKNDICIEMIQFNDNSDEVKPKISDSMQEEYKEIITTDKINTNKDKKKKTPRKESLYEIIFELKHNTDLVELIDRINYGKTNKLDKKKFSITLKTQDLDKFKEIKSYKNISITIFYSLVEKKKKKNEYNK